MLKLPLEHLSWVQFANRFKGRGTGAGCDLRTGSKAGARHNRHDRLVKLVILRDEAGYERFMRR
jgi:hypothetical protein